jgi:hypothetical protein
LGQKIQGIFVDPPIAIARLGGSNVPVDAYQWVESRNPRTDGDTVIAPWWTLDVNADGSVEPRKSDKILLRDGDLIRPVAPFFEIWALLGEDGSPPSRWRESPLTPALLKQFGADESAVTLKIDAKNRKAARRTGNKNLVFGTFEPLTVRADNHDRHTLFGVSPPDAKPPMIPRDRNIPLGSVQIMRSRPPAAGANWANDVDVEIMRFRFTPGRGRFYGPLEAAHPMRNTTFAAVEQTNAFLDGAAGWYGESTLEIFEPNDTEDTQTIRGGAGPSLGVVDDTCEARIDVTLTLPASKKKGKFGTSAAGRTFQTHANVFAGPPDFAPDRRPFLSLADELSDRSGDMAKRDAALDDQDIQAWVSDLFERIYETVSLLNLDNYQRQRAITLRGDALRKDGPVRNDNVSRPINGAMTKMDALRNPDTPVGAVGAGELLPLTEHAREKHRELKDITELQEFLSKYPRRLQRLVRAPFEVTPGETADDAGTSSMRMPPFMRHSSGFPLTLSNWQHELLMRWAAAQQPIPKKLLGARPHKLSKRAKARRDAVLARLGG